MVQLGWASRTLAAYLSRGAPTPAIPPPPPRSGIDMIKLGYVSRALPKDNKNHVILGTQAVKPRDFAAQVRRVGRGCKGEWPQVGLQSSSWRW